MLGPVQEERLRSFALMAIGTAMLVGAILMPTDAHARVLVAAQRPLRAHAHAHHSPLSLNAHHTRGIPLPPPHRHSHTRLPGAARHAGTPRLNHRDAGSRANGAADLPIRADAALSLAVLGACVRQRHRRSTEPGLEHIEGRGPPRAGPYHRNPALPAPGADRHTSRARAMTRPPGRVPELRAFRASRHSIQLRRASAHAALPACPIGGRAPSDIARSARWPLMPNQGSSFSPSP